VPGGLGDPGHLAEDLVLPMGGLAPLRVRGPGGGLDLRIRLVLDLLVVQLCPVVVGAGCVSEQAEPALEVGRGLRLVGLPRLGLLDGPLVDGQRPRERLDRAEQPLLQRDGDQRGGGLPGLRLALEALGPEPRVLVEERGQLELRRGRRQAVDVDLDDFPGSPP